MRWAPLAAILAFLLPATAAACSCAPMWMIAQSELMEARALIFVGTVEGQGSGPSSGPQDRLLRIHPHVSLRGSLPEGPVEVWAGSVEGWGDCGAPLVEGRTYLIVAGPAEDGKLEASRCSLTASLLEYGLLFSLLALLLLLAGFVMWGFWRWVRRMRSARIPNAARSEPREEKRWMALPLAWLAASAGLLSVAALLWSSTTRFPRSAAVTVCNAIEGAALEGVEAQRLPKVRHSTPVHLGQVPPGECRTARLASSEKASLRLSYELQGARFTVQDPALDHVEDGQRWMTVVQGPGKSESWEDGHAPDFRSLSVGLGLVASLAGALATLCVSAFVALAALGSKRRLD